LKERIKALKTYLEPYGLSDSVTLYWQSESLDMAKAMECQTAEAASAADALINFSYDAIPPDVYKAPVENSAV